MTAYNYIKLKYSDDSGEKMFRVVAEGYDDGTLNRTETIKRLIGGGLDHSVGAIYKTWSLVIRVLWSGDVSGYGTLSELEGFFKKNNPNATPSNVIKFTDHHGTLKEVHMVGPMQKMVLGCQIEGTQAWYLVRLILVAVAAET